jgi:hypothetical protein
MHNIFRPLEPMPEVMELLSIVLLDVWPEAPAAEADRDGRWAEGLAHYSELAKFLRSSQLRVQH